MARAIVVTDNFNRADSASIGSDWSENGGTWQIASNQLNKTSADGNFEIATWITSLGISSPADYEVSVDALLNSGSIGQPGVIARYIDSNNFYVWQAAYFGQNLS